MNAAASVRSMSAARGRDPAPVPKPNAWSFSQGIPSPGMVSPVLMQWLMEVMGNPGPFLAGAPHPHI